jgi:hypothetical protein
MAADLVEVMALAIYNERRREDGWWPLDEVSFRQDGRYALWTREAEAALRAISEAGYAVVPAEATIQVTRAFIDADPRRKRFAATAKRDYRAMIAAGRIDGAPDA